MDLLEPFKLKIEVNVLFGGEGAVREYVELLNQRYGTIKVDGRTALVRFYKEGFVFPSPRFEWHRNIIGLLTICDCSFLERYPDPADFVKQYAEIKQRAPTNVDVKKLIMLADAPIDLAALNPENEKGWSEVSGVSRGRTRAQKVELMQDLVAELIRGTLCQVADNTRIVWDPSKINWWLAEEQTMDQQHLLSKKKGRNEKWLLDLKIMHQDGEEAFRMADSVRAECKRQRDPIWVASVDTAKAACILVSRHLQGQPLIKENAETDEAVVVAEKALRRYGKRGKPEFELEVAFKLLNTYRRASRYREMFTTIKRITDQLVPKWAATKHILTIYATLVRVCESVGAHRKAALFTHLAGLAQKTQDESRLVRLLDTLESFGVARDPARLVSADYEQAARVMRLVQERNYRFVYRTRLNPGEEVVATRRLPPRCSVFLKEKDPIIKYNLEGAPWPRIGLRLLNDVFEFSYKHNTSKCNLSLQMYSRGRKIVGGFTSN